jgi:DNA (cytosine-5)-methyltransferase 1
MSMLNEFARVITEAEPLWWLMENVPRVPDLAIRGYHVQRFNVFAAEFGLRQLRNRSFQFGSRDGAQLVLLRGEKSQRLLKRAAMASDGKECRRSRTFADLCELQGLPRRFRIFGLSRRARFQIVGNGVPLPVGTAIAEAIRDRYLVNHSLVRLCVCGCGRTVTGKQVMATAACRKRMERRRVTAAADGHASADSQRLDDSQASSAESQDRSHSAAFAPFAAAAPGTAPEGLVQDGFKVCGAELLPGPDKAG